MSTVKIKLDSMDKIKHFNSIVSKFHCDFDLEQGRYYIDAKSILGIMSLDQASPMQLHFTTSDEETGNIVQLIEEFVIE